MKNRERGSGMGRTDNMSMNDKVENTSQLYNASIMQLKNAMKMQPEVRPLSITNRHLSLAQSSFGDHQEHQRTNSNLHKDKLRSVQNKTPNLDAGKYSHEISPLKTNIADATNKFKKQNFDRKTP